MFCPSWVSFFLHLHNYVSKAVPDNDTTLTHLPQSHPKFSIPPDRQICRDNSLASLENLIASSPTPFSHLLLETSGLANPGNLAPLFWTDAGLGSNVYLDGIVTLVDARNILRSLDEPGEEEVEGHPRAGSGDEKNEGNDDRDGGEEKGTCLGDGGKLLSTAHLQISHADVIILNKADMLAKEDLLAVETRIRSINAIARISITKYAQVPDLEGWVLGLKAYEGVEGLEDMMVQQQEKGKKGHSHLDPVSLFFAIFIRFSLPYF